MSFTESRRQLAVNKIPLGHSSRLNGDHPAQASATNADAFVEELSTVKTVWMWMLFFCFSIAALGQTPDELDQQFPENPQPVKRMLYGGYTRDKANEIKDPSPWTKKFIAAHVVMLAANAFDIETSQHAFKNGCTEGGFDGGGGRPGRSEMYGTDFSIAALFIFLDWEMQRGQPPKALRWLPYMVPVYVTQAHLRGAIRGIQRCW